MKWHEWSWKALLDVTKQALMLSFIVYLETLLPVGRLEDYISALDLEMKWYDNENPIISIAHCSDFKVHVDDTNCSSQIHRTRI